MHWKIVENGKIWKMNKVVAFLAFGMNYQDNTIKLINRNCVELLGNLLQGQLVKTGRSGKMGLTFAPRKSL